MPKTVNTPRDQLVCGKLDTLYDFLDDAAGAFDLIESIRHDCERMEAKLASRKDEVAELKGFIRDAHHIIDNIGTTDCGCDRLNTLQQAQKWLGVYHLAGLSYY